MRSFVLSLLLASCAPARSPRVEGPLADVAWIAGAWRGETKEGVVEELWSAPSGGMMLGTGRVVSGERVAFFEFIRIEARADGVFYVAQPRGGAPTEFRLRAATRDAATFENPTHDFPRVIVYRHEGDALITHVEGVENGAKVSEDVTLRRAP